MEAVNESRSKGGKYNYPIIVNADPRASSGEWSPPPAIPWPDVGIHLHVLPNGHVLTWADDDDLHYHDENVRTPDKLKAYVVKDVEAGAVAAVRSTTTPRTCSARGMHASRMAACS